MIMPGFTAEAALYKMRRHYRAAGEWAGATSGRVVLAQVPVCGTFAGCHVDPMLGANCPNQCVHRCEDSPGHIITECCPPGLCDGPPTSDDCCKEICCKASCA